jgi:two-component sensor histidine kinase
MATRGEPCPWQALIDAAFPPGVSVEECNELPLAPEPRNVGLARQFVLQHVPAADAGQRDMLAVLTSELATNVVVHARTEMQVVVMVAGDDAVIGVHDLDLGRSEVRTHERDGGRGLKLIAAVASAHGQVAHPTGGKVMWFRLPMHESRAS